MQFNHAGTRNERGVHLEKWVFRRCAHEHHGTIFHGMQKRILLAAAESVNFVHEQNRACACSQKALFSRGYFSAQIGNGATNGRHFHERRACGFGDDVGDARFSRARRTVQNDGRKRIGLNRRMKPTARPHRVFLARKLVKRTRTHAHSQRRRGEFLLVLYFSEQRVQLPPIYRFNTFRNRKRRDTS